MALFGRRRAHEELAADDDAEQDVGADTPPPPDLVPSVTTGPFDLLDLPDDDDAPRIDLGGLRIPVRPDVEVRVDVDASGAIVAATLATSASAMQLGAFAAPRSTGIWREVRAEISAQLEASGGRAREVEGPFGVELAAQVPTGQPGVVAPTRFLGVDGPRWFLRALLQGRAAVEGIDAEPQLAAALAGVVVVRGREAMPEREPIVLAMPREAQEALAAAAQGGVPADPAPGAGPASAHADPDPDAAQDPSVARRGLRSDDPQFDPLVRGPEITETR